MTIRNDYLNLADFCSGYVQRDEPIPVRTARVLVQALLDLADRAELLENATIRAHERPDAA